MQTLVIYLIVFLTALIAVLLIYIFGDKIYYFLENVLFGVVIVAAGVYFGYLLIKEYFDNHFILYFKKKHIFLRGKMIKKYSKEYTVPVPVYIDNENFSSLGNTQIGTFNEEVVEFEKEDGEIILLNLDEILSKKNDIVIDGQKISTVHCVKHFYDNDLHMIDVS